MSIVCGIDFSESSFDAARVAAGFARRTGQSLVLVHALRDFPVGSTRDEERHTLLASARRALGELAGELRSQGLHVEVQVEPKAPAEALPEVVAEHQARLLVFGRYGHGPRAFRVGSTADRLAQQTRTTALVVKDAAPFRRWLSGEGPLKVGVAVGFDPASEKAWQWARALAKAQPVSLVRLHVFSPMLELPALGLTGLRDEPRAEAEAENVLRDQLELRFDAGGLEASCRLEPAMGSPAGVLDSLARQLSLELLVVGSHPRQGLGRAWERSVSHGVLQGAPCAVACVPWELSAAPSAGATKSVLVAVDFTEPARAAIDVAWGLLGPGGTLHLVHVVAPGPRHDELDPRDIFKPATAPVEARQSARSQLERLAPEPTADKSVQCHLLELARPADAICQAAERLGVQQVVVGSHGRAGLRRAVLGSVSAEVVALARQPVTVVKLPRV